MKPGNLSTIRIPQSAPFKKILEALKLILKENINFEIRKEKGLLIRDVNETQDIVIDYLFPIDRIKLNTENDISFSLRSSPAVDYVKAMDAKSELFIYYDQKNKTLKYESGSKTNKIAAAENTYIESGNKDNHDEMISDMNGYIDSPICVVTDRIFKETLKDFKRATRNVEVFGSKNGIKFVANSGSNIYSSVFGEFDEKSQFKILECKGERLYSLHKMVCCSKIVRIYVKRIEIDNEIHITPLIFKLIADEVGDLTIYLKDISETENSS